jgi:hypothetical protein
MFLPQALADMLFQLDPRAYLHMEIRSKSQPGPLDQQKKQKQKTKQRRKDKKRAKNNKW